MWIGQWDLDVVVVVWVDQWFLEFQVGLGEMSVGPSPGLVDQVGQQAEDQV